MIAGGAKPDIKVGRDIVTTGNTSSASIPIALDRMRAAGEAKSGDLVLAVAFGAGLTYASQVFQMPVTDHCSRGLARRSPGSGPSTGELDPRVRRVPSADGGRMRHNSRGYPSRLRSGERPSPPKGTTVSNEDIIAGLGEIVEEVAGVSAADVTADKSFTDDLDIDSLSMVEIAVQAEDKFGVKIPDDELANLKTVGDAVAYIEANKA